MNKCIRSLHIVFMLFVIVNVCLAAGGTRIADITLEHEGKAVKLEGKVVEVEPKDQYFAELEGLYVLRDEYGSSIKVWTEKLPRVGEYVKVKGAVSIDQSGGLFIRQQQLSWLEKYYIYVMVIAAAVVVILVLVLGILTVRPRTPIEEFPAPSAQKGKSAAAKSDTTPVPPAGPTKRLLEPRASLLVLDGPAKGKSYEITEPDILIGRDDECDVQLPESDTSVSRRHARIKYANKQYTIINESGTNTTKVNGEETESKALQDGDEIKLGGVSLQLKYLSDK